METPGVKGQTFELDVKGLAVCLESMMETDEKISLDKGGRLQSMF